MMPRLLARPIGLLLMLLPVATFAEVTPYPPYPGAVPSVVNIQDYKVDHTGKTLETAKINQAISDVSARPEGGVLFFPTGVYLTGTVLMKSNVKLYVDADAMIRGSRTNADYTSASTPAGGRQLRAFIISSPSGFNCRLRILRVGGIPRAPDPAEMPLWTISDLSTARSRMTAGMSISTVAKTP